jgi:hypothetical protein
MCAIDRLRRGRAAVVCGRTDQPVLVLNGDSDKMVPTKNTVDLHRRLPNSQLVIYPDAGHGGVFQSTRTSSSGLWSSSERARVMKAFVVEQYGKDGLRAADVLEPEVGDGDVLVKVGAASVNPLDKMVRNGEFKQLLRYRTPFVLGHDVAGVVTRVGSAVRDFQVGDEVYARPATCGSGPSRSTSRSTRGRRARILVNHR